MDVMTNFVTTVPLRSIPAWVMEVYILDDEGRLIGLLLYERVLTSAQGLKTISELMSQGLEVFKGTSVCGLKGFVRPLGFEECQLEEYQGEVSVESIKWDIDEYLALREAAKYLNLITGVESCEALWNTLRLWIPISPRRVEAAPS